MLARTRRNGGQLLCGECAAIDLGAVQALAQTRQATTAARTTTQAAATVELHTERLQANACAPDGTRIQCSVCLDSMRAGQLVVRPPLPLLPHPPAPFFPSSSLPQEQSQQPHPFFHPSLTLLCCKSTHNNL